ncbi:hypothetical protein P175DRAFT_0456283 [Aspergillus ochraceoroseus IBT 24754]|uniref:UEV domain-containing protein n=1 Tax=Aspergillus ochraceoroseus IBT 24754 TaxID=1392256 RepID=A0A2T5LZ39_9EURO|nr:uncharacterized protein P175DRAFT_0456283 [Aspergillus ochraceoroseus IBT 24754]PTU21549.1 hypothetical protein P175DRAFT_0456283 [Aspergillus ochraceoroseus IBT 24754]
MAAVPQRTLNWLYSILIRDHYDPRQTYQDPNRTYSDVANTLAQYPSLSPQTEVYTYENGFSALLLQLKGTLPVTFRGTVYKFPITLWIPNAYPREPPLVYVIPTQDMAVRVGQHVTLEGRVYHHYLAHWAEAWERSSLVDLLTILREVFAKEPPVRYKQQGVQQQPIPQQVQTPPPRPPLPPELGGFSAQSPSPQPHTVSPPHPVLQGPPRPPPKPGPVVGPEQQRQQQRQQNNHATQYGSPPPLPPLPPKDQTYRPSVSHSHAAVGSPSSGAPQYLPQQADFRRNTPAQPQQQPSNVMPQSGSYSHGPTYRQPSVAHGGHDPRHGTPQYQPPAQFRGPQAPPQPTHHQRPPPSQQLPHHPSPHGTPQASPGIQPSPRSKPQTQDLLTSPFEVELPSFAPTGPAPPIPPNPEKDALLQAVSKTVTETLQTNIVQSESAAQSLISQSQSLHAAITTLQGEISSLSTLNSTLEANTSVLQQSLHRADVVIADAQTRASSSPANRLASSSTDPAPASSPGVSGLPPIDEVLVAPTVVGKQLYDLVAEERGIQQAIYALQVALVKGIIGVETWSRHTRGLAREAFLKRALIRKIGKGMGLEEHP